MNWYKKAQLEKTLPYFEEFKEYGDYIPDQNELNQTLLNKFDTTIEKDLGAGDSGVAYSLANGDVLKITTNPQEGKVALFFMEHQNPHVINYKNVWKKGDLYYIIMERVNKFVSDIPELKETFDYIGKLLDKHKCYNVNCSLGIIERDNNIDITLKNKIMEYLKGLTNIPYQIFDFLNPNNAGIKDGEIVFFDIN